MEIKINVDESMFSDILDKELKALKPEELHEVLIQCIREYFTVDNYKNMEKLFVENSSNYYGGNHYKATDFTEKLVRDCDYSSLQEIVDKSIELLKTNYRDILETLLLKSIVRSLSSTCSMQETIRSTVDQVLYEKHQSNNQIY